MDKSVIDLNVVRAISEINNNLDFIAAKDYINKALSEVGSNTKLTYYDVLKNVLIKVYWNVRGNKKKHQVKEVCSKLLHFYQREFENIVNVEIDVNSETEMEICSGICDSIISSINSIVQSIRSFYIDFGLIAVAVNNAKWMNEYVPIVLKCEKAARDILLRFNNKSSKVEQNLKTWNKDINGKYGAKYLS